ncbi:MAG: glycosyltransferase family 2 protein [Deferribacterales bacterium]
MGSVHISVVVPVYKCKKALPELCSRLAGTLSEISEDYEIILIDDMCPDNSWDEIKAQVDSNKKIRGIRLSRNFGQHSAITAGLNYSRGEYTVVMDCDLQDQPEEILKLYKKITDGFDIVFARRSSRKDNFTKRLSSYLFYKIYGFLADNKVDHKVANFSIINRKVLDVFNMLKEKQRSYYLLINWLGFRTASVDVEHAPRTYGKSSYSFAALIGFAIESVVSQSNKPLVISVKIGFISSLFSLLYTVWLVFRYFTYGIPVQGWASVMVSIYFIGGLIIANMGILGLYIGKMFDEIKGRPIYIVSETTFE